ncbi:mandelate racemase/muconate lactonizing enzyme family protein [Pseudoroseomonas wenyumeiae]|uniref:Mandelate racemase/muconate lactonizing enzyme family protein n=1 Tax=Teichococcus wenyumeiae TaxID=2478470 RepID=A0A3A9J9R0_9PROT|nr:mandelate racemase/muconate lactonizing enzyme family protein [Pseudoroseomonas wenyumeiae]RKK03997.1 mandelate racemase/muconate lactonizing enzyme family protein [Pseudoroseomonas wenyumeiae]RMI19395.1 mandelate racemase/muconate lactonizing enzyme family protein [Pseudoroseomonas wenyumeiae]RMI20294.1 mandelate racemase/muconate lactonizing enzyme family protein [Pseudoroseomonas wenyumeiae]
MRITELRISIVQTARLHPVVVEIRTSEGITGIGEAGIAYGLGATAAAGMLRDIGERMLIGADPFRIEALWSEMYDHTFWAKGGGPIVFAAISAIEQALWDIKGRALGVPVYELLGGRIRDDVRLYHNGWGQPHREVAPFVQAAEKAVAEGYDALKFYPFAYREAHPQATSRHPSRRDLPREALTLAYEKVKALRGAVGPDVDILLDLSGGLTTDETIRFCRKIEEFDIFFVEEPCDPFDTGTLKKISDSIRMPVAAGERLYTRYGFKPVLEARAVDIIQPDLGLTGGIMEGKKIAAMAEAYGMRVQPHVCGSPLATAVALQFAACIPNFAIQEIYPMWQEMEGYVEITDDPPEGRIQGGRVSIPDRPGLGMELRQEVMAPFLWATVGGNSQVGYEKALEGR